MEGAEEIFKELTTIMQHHHTEHICKVYGGCIVFSENGGPEAWLVMEYADGGDLHTFLTTYNGPLPEDLRYSFLCQATKALASLHNAPTPILHRDIKSLNFLVQLKDCKLLLSDFGLSKAKELIASVTSTIGTVRWAAPEILETNKPQWSEKADIWSLGMVFYEIVTQNLPYHEEFITSVITKVKAGTLPDIPSTCPKVCSFPPFLKLICNKYSEN